MIIVTADEKEDWWWRRQATLLGPRPELTLEFHKLSGHRLFLMRPPELLARASALDVEIDEQSFADADRRSEETDVQVPWTSEALEALLERLDDEAPVQAAAIRLAVQSGGRVSREQVYELGNFPNDRMLRGFTRPPVRLTTALQAEGIIPENVLPILVARYPDGVKASYFMFLPSFLPGSQNCPRRKLLLPTSSRPWLKVEPAEGNRSSLISVEEIPDQRLGASAAWSFDRSPAPQRIAVGPSLPVPRSRGRSRSWQRRPRSCFGRAATASGGTPLATASASIAGVSRVNGGAAPTVLQGRSTWARGKPLPSPARVFVAESARRPGKRGRTARTALSLASAGVRRP